MLASNKENLLNVTNGHFHVDFIINKLLPCRPQLSVTNCKEHLWESCELHWTVQSFSLINL